MSRARLGNPRSVRRAQGVDLTKHTEDPTVALGRIDMIPNTSRVSIQNRLVESAITLESLVRS